MLISEETLVINYKIHPSIPKYQLLRICFHLNFKQVNIFILPFAGCKYFQDMYIPLKILFRNWMYEMFM